MPPVFETLPGLPSPSAPLQPATQPTGRPIIGTFVLKMPESQSTSSVTTASIDMPTEIGSGLFSVLCGSAGSTGTVTATLQESPDGSNWHTIATLALVNTDLRPAWALYRRQYHTLRCILAGFNPSDGPTGPVAAFVQERESFNQDDDDGLDAISE